MVTALQEFDFVRTIAPDDAMHKDGDEPFYFQTGRAALGRMRRALALAGKSDPGRILDLPSGHGRVLRMLRGAYPEARITACDIEAGAVAFCAEAFGAIPVVSRPDPAEIDFGAEFDLIWCGSLLTHLDEARWHAFLDLFERSLAPEGVLVFTTSGRRVVQILSRGLEFGEEQERLAGLSPAQHRRHARSGKARASTAELCDASVAKRWYDLPASTTERVLRDYAETGFGFSPYEWTDDFGLTVASPAWVCRALERLPSLRLLGYTERAWVDSQDVVACVKEE